MAKTEDSSTKIASLESASTTLDKKVVKESAKKKTTTPAATLVDFDGKVMHNTNFALSKEYGEEKKSFSFFTKAHASDFM